MIYSTWYLRGGIFPQGISGMNGLDMNPRIVGDRFASPRARQGGDARRWFTGITSGAVVLASGIIGMAPASAAPCGSATEFSGTYTVTVTGNCEWTPPALVTWADVVVVGGGGGAAEVTVTQPLALTHSSLATVGAEAISPSQRGWWWSLARRSASRSVLAALRASQEERASVAPAGLRISALCLLLAAREVRLPTQRPSRSKRVAVRV